MFILNALNLDEKGYNYIVLDECWLNKERDQNGNLQPDKNLFPSGSL